jgi:hypothetical protein
MVHLLNEAREKLRQKISESKFWQSFAKTPSKYMGSQSFQNTGFAEFMPEAVIRLGSTIYHQSFVSLEIHGFGSGD